MWSRVVEIMLGVWLIISPFIFQHPTSHTSWWVNDMAVGLAVILFGIFSYWEPTRLAHIGTLIAGAWLIGFAYYYGFGGAPAASQNHLILGMLLMMFGLIPSEAEEPPKSWERRRLSSNEF